MHTRTKRCALTATLAIALAAPARADEQTVRLIQLLIQKGILTSGQASELLKETGAPAHHAPKPQAAEPAPAPARQGEIRVTYVPQFVRKQIADEVRAEVMTQAQTEGWAAPDALPEWTKRIRVYGDLRARAEDDLFNRNNYNGFLNFASINAGNPFDLNSYTAGTVANPPLLNTTEDRTRFRVRARFGVEAQISDGVAANIRLGTGDTNGPVSTNATLGSNGAFSKYAIYLDRAFISFAPTSNLSFEAGRTSNPFSTTDILFYSELGFDGISARYQHDIGPSVKAYITGGAFPLFNTDFNFSSNDPSKFASTNAYLFAGQAGVKYQIKPDLTAGLAAGFFDFEGVQGAVSAPCTIQSGSVFYCNTDDTRYLNGQFGNTLYAIRDIVPNGTTVSLNPQYFGLASRFSVLEVHPTFVIDTYAPVAIQVEGEFIKNLAFNRATILSHGPVLADLVGPVNNFGSSPAGKLNEGPYQGGDTGYMAKVTVGHTQIKRLWDWQAYLGYKYIESDATIDALDDSEFHLGGTNARGYFVGGQLGVADSTYVSLKYMSSQVVSGPPDGNDVVLLDLNTSF